MPLEVTHGGHSKLGCGVFRWGTVVIDYPGRRFWLLPHAEQPGPPDVSVSGVTVALDGQVVNAGGSLTGGSRQQKEAGFLSRGKEIDEQEQNGVIAPKTEAKRY